jgi:hypothetical protein
MLDRHDRLDTIAPVLGITDGKYARNHPRVLVCAHPYHPTLAVLAVHDCRVAPGLQQCLRFRRNLDFNEVTPYERRTLHGLAFVGGR